MCLLSAFLKASPIIGLLERIEEGLSKKIVTETISSEQDFFELDQKGDKIIIRGNNYVSIATGVNWYLKYYAGIHLSWNGMKADLPNVLPPVLHKERRQTNLKYRYALNYCTFSYSMAFWDWKRWEREIDWMALHGINLPLAVVGTDVVWRNTLVKLGYSLDEINEFIAGPGFQAWWLMNNLEGWGGPNPDSWYEQQETLQKRILKRMREFGMEPILPGYSGMLPHNAKEKLGVNVSDPGIWQGYSRPAFLQPTDSRFESIAKLYYQELTHLYGQAKFYSMDPFHEGGNTDGVDLEAAGKAIWKAMKLVNPESVWVIQAWGANPREEMVQNLPASDMVILDLFSESRPQWGDPSSTWCRKDGFEQHDWIYCMLLNFGANVGLHGKMKHVIDEFYKAKKSRFGKTLKGVGMTPEGIENNPVMYELLCELPWRETYFDKDAWLKGYVKARYGIVDDKLIETWILLSNSIYNCPASSTQQGTHESIFCARPSLNAYQVSAFAEIKDYYLPEDVINAAIYMISLYDKYKSNNNFEYDLVDISRQALAEKGRIIYKMAIKAFQNRNKKDFKKYSNQFLDLILLQDKLLSTRSEFKVGTWIQCARDKGITLKEKQLYEWNARVQITTWGNRIAANEGNLRDYAHKEWSGILRDLYYVRWKIFFDELILHWDKMKEPIIDYYQIEENWTLSRNSYPSYSESDLDSIIKDVYLELQTL